MAKSNPRIEIDEGSGFCFGVVYAIRMAESELENTEKLYSLGDIVHNGMEVERLASKGLITIDHDQLHCMKGGKVLIRAHGEPPQTYKLAMQNGIELVDASCPVVLKLQKNIKKGHDNMRRQNGQTVIYGKKGHAEVNGLVGQTNGEAIVVNETADLDKLDFARPISIFSQTTRSPEGYKHIIDEMEKRREPIHGPKPEFIIHRTICGQVATRDKELSRFALAHQVIIFVSGRKSSNGRMLYQVCREANARSHFVSMPKELEAKWFVGAETIGICGATSTPRWLMEDVAEQIQKMSGGLE